MPSLSSPPNVPTAPFDLSVCTGALCLQDISNALLWFLLQILTIIYRPFLTSSHLMWWWKVHIKEHVSFLTVQSRRQQNQLCSSVFSICIPFLHTSLYLLISHCHWSCYFSYCFLSYHFLGKQYISQTRNMAVLMHFKISPHTQGTRFHLCNLDLPLTHSFSLEFWQVGETPVSEVPSHLQ